MFQFIVQLNNKLCVYSVSQNKFLIHDASDEDVVEFMINNSFKREVIEQRTRDLITAARHAKEPIHKFLLTYREAMIRIGGNSVEKVYEIADKNGTKIWKKVLSMFFK